ncbi:MAG: hypothetical protein AMXMBFR47_34020 [Planctomycetota bacterium]
MVVRDSQLASILPGYSGLRVTADEFFGLPDDGNRYELIDGVVTMSPSPSVSHQRVSGLIFRLLSTYVEERGLGECFYEIDVHFGTSEDGRDIVYRPDVICYIGAASQAENERLRLVPSVVVEVVSPESRNRDSHTKLRDYSRFGVAEYWLIDPSADVVRLYRRVGDNLEEQPIDRGLESVAVPGFCLDLAVVRKSFRP